MCSDKTMDRVICGDVGFGKIEVILRASFVSVNNKTSGSNCANNSSSETTFSNF